MDQEVKTNGKEPITESSTVYQLRVMGKTVKILHTEEEAEAWRKALCDEPDLFTDILPWEPGYLMPFVKFDEDQESTV